MQTSDAEHSAAHTVAAQVAVAQDLVGLHAGERASDEGAHMLMGAIVLLLQCAQFDSGGKTFVSVHRPGSLDLIRVWPAVPLH